MKKKMVNLKEALDIMAERMDMCWKHKLPTISCVDCVKEALDNKRNAMIEECIKVIETCNLICEEDEGLGRDCGYDCDEVMEKLDKLKKEEVIEYGKKD